MKLLFFLVLLISLALEAEPTECTKKTKEVYKTEKEACSTLFGVEKSNCVETAKEKLRASTQDCKVSFMDCISKSTKAKEDSKKSCSGKEPTEKFSCIKSTEEEFVKSKYECRKI
jgi:hypothetical protein